MKEICSELLKFAGVFWIAVSDKAVPWDQNKDSRETLAITLDNKTTLVDIIPLAFRPFILDPS